MRMIATALLAGVLLSPFAGGPAVAAASCGPKAQSAGLCSVSNSGSQVDVSGTQHQPGANPRPPSGGGPGGPSTPRDSADDCEGIECRGGYAVEGLPDVTLADLASFVPARPTLTGEPDGVGVVGMPTNLVARATEQRITGTLFDFDVVVRFVPTGFRFAYGDGASRTASTGGASWSALGQADFTPTPTSHVYERRGTFRASVTVLYSAAVDFGGGWRPVPGVVEATTSGYGIRVVEVHTALVDKTCIENPGGPGC